MALDHRDCLVSVPTSNDSGDHSPWPLFPSTIYASCNVLIASTLLNRPTFEVVWVSFLVEVVESIGEEPYAFLLFMPQKISSLGVKVKVQNSLYGATY